MTGPEIAVYIWSTSVTTLLIVVFCKIHKKSKRDHEHYQHNFYNYIGSRHAQLEEEERPLLLALPEPRQEQTPKNIISRFMDSYQIEKEILQEKKEAEKLRRKEEKIRYTPTEKLDPSMLEVKVPEVSLSLAQMRNSEDIDVAMKYYDIVAEILISLIKYSKMLETRYPEVKLIRDTSKSGYPGVVSINILTKSQFEHTIAGGGIFWEAGVVESNEKGHTVLAIDHEYRLEQWFEKEGYIFEKEEESEEAD